MTEGVGRLLCSQGNTITRGMGTCLYPTLTLVACYCSPFEQHSNATSLC